jgi:non-ribosomal peptide synthase protein (TIGR01720 family)
VAPQAVAERTRSQGKRPRLADWFYAPVWKQSFSPALTEPSDLAAETSTWLLFVNDSEEVAARIVQRLKQAGQEVICVQPAHHFEQLTDTDTTYTINPQRPDDYDALLNALHAADRLPQQIVHCWSVTPGNAGTAAHEKVMPEQDAGYYSLLFLAQALAQQNTLDTLHITVISDNMQCVIGTEHVLPEKGMLLAPCKIIPQEYPHITCSNLDVVLPPVVWQQEELADQLMAELAAGPGDAVVAYRSGQRWVQSFEPLHLNENRVTATSRLRQSGVYLILGGLGGIGMALAEHLARAAQARLILVGRSVLPARATWNDWLAAHDEQDVTSRKIRDVQMLEALGAEVLVISADIADQEEMEHVLRQAEERFGPLHGVIHVAGVAGRQAFRSIAETERTESELQFRSKVAGLVVLERVLGERPLDFCLLVSSLSAVLGGLGLMAYTAANLFMDAFTRRHNQFHPVPWFSVNWDNWRTSEHEGAATADNRMIQASLDLAMSREEGLQAMLRALAAASRTPIIVSTADLQTRIDQWISREAVRSAAEQAGTTGTRHARPALPNSYVAPETEIQHTLVHIWEEQLGITPVGIHDNFFELGGYSLMSIQIIDKAKKSGLNFTPQQMFEHQTIARLAEVAGTGQEIQAEQKLVSGSLPLTPIQHWFFEQDIPDRHHWNQAVMLEVVQPLAPALLQAVVQQLLLHHDALRLRFIQEGADWQAYLADHEEASVFEEVNLSEMPPQARTAAIEAAAAERQASLSLVEGPLVRVLYFHCGPEPARLLLIIHHLAVDAVSWRILLEDLETACRQRSQGAAITLPSKTTSLKQWSERLSEYAQHPALEHELAYWCNPVRREVEPLPVDMPGGQNSLSSVATVQRALESDETHTLLHAVPQIYRTEINDVLLAALLQTLTQWTAAPLLLVDMEGHGREPLFEDVNVSHTVGWFTTIYPVLLNQGEIDDCDNPGEVLKSVKEQLRRIPGRGIGYGLLRYLRTDTHSVEQLRNFPQAELSFLYLGQLNQEQLETSITRMSSDPYGPLQSPRGPRRHLLEISAMVIEHRLQVTWRYSTNLHRPATIAQLAGEFIGALRELIDHCQSPDAGGETPSDFPLADLDEAGLSVLSSLLEAADQSEEIE